MDQDCCVCLFVDDYDKGIQFYCNTLGLFKVDANTDFGDGSRFVYLRFSDKQILFSMHLVLAQLTEVELVGRQAGNQLFISLPIEDADLLMNKLAKDNVDTEGGIIELPYGRQIILRDCFGNRLALFQRLVD